MARKLLIDFKKIITRHGNPSPRSSSLVCVYQASEQYFQCARIGFSQTPDIRYPIFSRVVNAKVMEIGCELGCNVWGNLGTSRSSTVQHGGFIRTVSLPTLIQILRYVLLENTLSLNQIKHYHLTSMIYTLYTVQTFQNYTRRIGDREYVFAQMLNFKLQQCYNDEKVYQAKITFKKYEKLDNSIIDVLTNSGNFLA